jgi:hypothetical protein
MDLGVEKMSNKMKRRCSMKKIYLVTALLFTLTTKSQSLKDHLPSAIFTFLGGASDGLRDASMFRMDRYGSFWNGKVSWLNKYRNRDPKQGPAYFGSTSFLVFTTDGPHLANFFTHQFNGLAYAYAPGDKNRKFGHVLLKVLAYNTVRQMGHSLVYGGIFKSTYGQ